MCRKRNAGWGKSSIFGVKNEWTATGSEHFVSIRSLFHEFRQPKDGLVGISPEAKATLTYLCITISGYGFGIFAMFYGIAAAVRGALIWRSGYLPRALGATGILGGASFVVKNFLIVLAPQFDLPYVIAPMMLARLSMGSGF